LQISNNKLLRLNSDYICYKYKHIFKKLSGRLLFSIVWFNALCKVKEQKKKLFWNYLSLKQSFFTLFESISNNRKKDLKMFRLFCSELKRVKKSPKIHAHWYCPWLWFKINFHSRKINCKTKKSKDYKRKLFWSFTQKTWHRCPKSIKNKSKK
jgi:hypothetical protein